MFTFSLIALTLVASTRAATVGSYFPNWAQYRPAPFTFTPAQLSGVASVVDDINYAFAFFCPLPSWAQPYWVTQLQLCKNKKPFEIISIEPKDPQFYQQIVALKSMNQNLRVILSVGGWTFPSHFFSGMVSSKANRATFIQSAMSMMQQYGFDGIDIDWEYPCSKPRQDEVKITCQKFDPVTDQGGADCATDKQNLNLLIQEMRQAFGSSKVISIAGRGILDAGGYDVATLQKSLDYFNVMTYDYSVSDIKNAQVTQPNSPLMSPTEPGVSNWSISYGIGEYMKKGGDPSKLRIGIAYYGHTWYVPGMSGTAWQKFGLPATMQGECCGPFAQTYGAKYGKYSGQCGLMMYSEILAAGFQKFFDPQTQSNIGYLSSMGKDGYTAAGTWLTYNDEEALGAILTYVKKLNISGVFAFDLSMDTNDGSGPTYALTKYLKSNV